MANAADLRTHPRLQTRAKVEIKLIGTSAAIQGMAYREATTRDISAGGAFIELLNTHLTAQNESVVDDFLLLKSEIHMRISLPDRDNPVIATGKAVWIEKEVPGKEYRQGIAISFTQIGDEDRAYIDSFVLSRV